MGPKSRRTPTAALLGLLLPLGTLAAQAPLLRVTTGAGQATDLRGARSAAAFLAPSVTFFPSPSAAIALLGRGSRFDGGVWAAGGGLAFLARAPLAGPVTFTLQGSGDITRASWRATYLQGDVTPSLELVAGPVTLHGGIRGVAARSSSETSGPGAGPLPGALRTVVVTRQDAGAAFGAQVELARTPRGDRLRLRYREEHLRPEGTATVDRVLGADLTRGPVTLAAHLGHRRAPGEDRAFGGGEMSLDLARGIAVVAAAESYPSNRFTGTLGGRSVTLGLSLSHGGLGAPRALPRPVGAPPLPPGLTRLSLRAPSARQVEVAGDWNGWRPVALVRAPNGVWYVDLPIAPGEYRYAFRKDGGVWTVPEGVAAVEDGFGGRSAWLTVPGDRRSAAPNVTRKEAP